MNTDANEVIDRLQIVFGVTTDTELANIISSTKQTVYSWRTRNSVPYAICIQAAQDKGIDLNWLLKGEGDMFRNNYQDRLAPEEQAVLKLYQELDPKQKSDVLSFAEEKKQYNVMRKQIERLIGHQEQQQMSA